DLALEIRALHDETALLVDEAVPGVDVGDAGLLGAATEQIVEIAQVRRRLGATDRRKPDPEHRHVLGLERRDRVIDALDVELGPFVGAEFVADHAGRRAFRLGRGRVDRRLVVCRVLLLVVALLVDRRGLLLLRRRAWLRRRLRRGLGGRLFLDRPAVVEAD